MKVENSRINLIKAVISLTTDQTRLKVQLEQNIRCFRTEGNNELLDRIAQIQDTKDMFNDEIINNHDLL